MVWTDQLMSPQKTGGMSPWTTRQGYCKSVTDKEAKVEIELKKEHVGQLVVSKMAAVVTKKGPRFEAVFPRLIDSARTAVGVQQQTAKREV